MADFSFIFLSKALAPSVLSLHPSDMVVRVSELIPRIACDKTMPCS